MDKTRLIAVKILELIFFKKTHAEEAFEKVFQVEKDIEKLDRSFVMDLVYGVVKHKLTLDYIISCYITNQLSKTNPKVLIILNCAVYQILYMRVPDYASVDTSVELAKKLVSKKSASFINAVLRNIIRNKDNITYPDLNADPIKHISIKYSHPEWMIKRWIKRFGVDNTIKLVSINNIPPLITVNINPLVTTKEKVIEKFKLQGIDIEESTIICDSFRVKHNIGHLVSLPGYKEGEWYIQDNSSALVVEVLDPQEDENIIDLCAAPGTKTIRMAIKMKGSGQIISLDTNSSRLQKIYENCYRMGLLNVKICKADGRDFQLDKNTFVDKVLIDAPCSNTGVLRKRADARWNKSSKDIEKLAKLQLELLTNASNLICPEGIIVYSVCSIEEEEGIEVIKTFLNKHPNFSLLNIRNYLPEHLKNKITKDYAELLPFENDTDGFFISIIKKN